MDGNSTWDLEQERSHNAANEITGITTTTGTQWEEVQEDAAGNITWMPFPLSPQNSAEPVYDAWNRLVAMTDGELNHATYEYDGLGERIVRSVYASGTLNHRIHYYYNDRWQLLEERKEVSGTEDPDPLAQYVWHPYYIDALAVRHYDADTNGCRLAEPAATHECPAGRCFVWLDLKDLVQPRDLEHLSDVRRNRAESELDLELLALLLDLHQLAQHGRRHELHVAEIENHPLLASSAEQGDQVFAHLFQLHFVEYPGVGKTNREDPVLRIAGECHGMTPSGNAVKDFRKSLMRFVFRDFTCSCQHRDD